MKNASFKRYLIGCIGVGLTLMSASATALVSGGSTLSVDWHTIDSGGGHSASPALTLSGTIGQHDTGEMTGGSFSLSGGFWAAPAAAAPGNPADIDGDGSVGFNDLLILLASWGECPSPPDPCSADIDVDGSVGFADLLIILASWSG